MGNSVKAAIGCLALVILGITVFVACGVGIASNPSSPGTNTKPAIEPVTAVAVPPPVYVRNDKGEWVRP